MNQQMTRLDYALQNKSMSSTKSSKGDIQYDPTKKKVDRVETIYPSDLPKYMQRAAKRLNIELVPRHIPLQKVKEEIVTETFKPCIYRALEGDAPKPINLTRSGRKKFSIHTSCVDPISNARLAYSRKQGGCIPYVQRKNN